MKNLLINPKISVNKKRKETNDVIDHALTAWLIKNSYNPIIMSNNTLMIKKSFLHKFLKSTKVCGIILSGGNNVDKRSKRYHLQKFLIEYAKKKKIPI